MHFRVATYNIHRAIGRDGRQSPARIADVLRELNADVVALQEVGFRTDPVGDVIDYLAGATKTSAIAGETFRDPRGPYGNAVLSRLPIVGFERIDLSKPGREPRGAIDLRLGLGDTNVQVVATHLGLRPRERRKQTARLLSAFEASAADLKILLGDFNELLPWGRPLRSLERAFGRSPAPATFPSRWPLLPLDRLWAKPSRAVQAVAPHASDNAKVASDHLPLVAELDLRRLGSG